MLLSAVVLACLAFPGTGAAATFAVNVTGDGPVTGTCATGEACTLRDAVAAANGSTTDPQDTITVPAGRYVLSEGQLEVSGTASIVGVGARATVVDGAGQGRVFNLSNGDLTIEGLTVTGGVAPATAVETFAGDGGGILDSDGEELTLRRVAVTGNSAALNGAGVAAPPEQTGMATFVGKTVVIEDSTIAGNRVTGGVGEALGGGVYALGELVLTNSTVTGNSVESTAGTDQGGGVVVGPPPGVGGGTATRIVNSTIAGNSVPAGGIGGGLAVYNPTALASSSTITNTIIAANTAGGAASDCGPITLTSNHNLSGDASCMFTDAGSKTSVDAKLGALANNGGETDTLALLAGSPAIDAGTAEGCPATDQRGVARPIGSACDIGAYEFRPAPVTPPAPKPPAVATTADLSLKIKAKPKKPARGKKLAFLVTTRDAGPATATGVVFKGTVPGATTKVKGKGLGRKACKLGKIKKGKRALTCQLGTIAAGTKKAFRVLVETGEAPKKTVARGRVRSSLTDPTLKNAKAKAVAKIKG